VDRIVLDPETVAGCVSGGVIVREGSQAKIRSINNLQKV